MKKIIVLGLCLLSALTASSFAQPNPSTSTKYAKLANEAEEYFTKELTFLIGPGGVKKAVLSENKDVVIVDVRRRDAFEKGHVPGAINIPFDEHKGFEGNELEFAGLKKDGFNYIYCYELLCNLAQKAAKKFASLGYPVKEMRGGFKSWEEHNYPVATGGEK